MCEFASKMLLEIHAVLTFMKILSSPDEDIFPKRPSGSPRHTKSKFYDAPSFFNPPSFATVSCFICSCRRMPSCYSTLDDLSCSYATQ